MKEICTTTGTANGEIYNRHPLVYLMEAADDIAYATADIEDGLKKGMFTLDQFIAYFEEKLEDISDEVTQKKYSVDLLESLKNRIKNKDRSNESDLIDFQKWMELARKWLMYVVAYSFSKNYTDILKGTYKYDMFFNTNHQETIKILKGAMVEFVYNHEYILKLEMAAKKIIETLMDDFVYAVIYWKEESEGKYQQSKADTKLMNIISENYKSDYDRVKTDDDAENLYLRFLIVTDYISGMTDSYAKNLYRELNGID